jgi:hypothetical protein
VFVFSPGDKVQRRVVQYLEFDLGAAILEGESSRGGGQVATGALPTEAQLLPSQSRVAVAAHCRTS